jgi:hypothetical protein
MKTKQALSMLAFLAATAKTQACAVCAGGDNVQLAEASNSVLWALLALVGFIFVATGATAFFLWRKATKAATPHSELITSLNPADAEA